MKKYTIAFAGLLILILIIGIIYSQETGSTSSSSSSSSSGTSTSSPTQGSKYIIEQGGIKYDGQGTNDPSKNNAGYTSAYLTSENNQAPSSQQLSAVNQWYGGNNQLFSEGMSSSQISSARQQLEQKFQEQYGQQGSMEMERLKKSAEFMQKNLPPDKQTGKIGSIEVENEGDMTLRRNTEKSTEEVYAKIPKDYKVSNENSGKDLVLEKEGKETGNPLVLKGKDGNNFLEFSNVEKGGKVTFSDQSGVRDFKLIGQGDVKLKQIPLGASLIDHAVVSGDYKGIKDGRFKVDSNDNLRYAEFISVNSGKYSIDNSGKAYNFDTKKNGKITFDRDNGRLETEGSKVSVEDKYSQQGEQKIKYNAESDKVSIKINSNGEPEKFSLLGENNKLTKEFEDGQSLVSSSKKSLDVYFNKKEFDSSVKDNLNSVYLPKQGIDSKAYFNGEVGFNGNGIQYKGKEKTFSEFDLNSNSFDVKNGDATIFNGNHLATIKNNDLELNRANLNLDSLAESFDIRYKDSNGISKQAIFDESGDRLLLKSMNSNDNSFKTAVVPLSLAEGNIGDASAIQERFVNYLDGKITQLRSQGGGKSEIDSFELMKIQAESIKAGNEYGSLREGQAIEETIQKLENYLKTERSSESALDAKLYLAENYIRGAGIERENTASMRYEALELYKGLEGSTKNNPSLNDQVRFAHAEAYMKLGETQNAIDMYKQIAQSASSDNVASLAHMQKATAELQNKNFADAYSSLQDSLEKNPGNIQARDMRNALQRGALESRFDQLLGEKSSVQEEFNKVFGQSTLRSFWSSGLGAGLSDLGDWTKYQEGEYQNRMREFFGDQKFKELMDLSEAVKKGVPISELSGLNRKDLDSLTQSYKLSTGYEGVRDPLARYLTDKYKLTQAEAYSTADRITSRSFDKLISDSLQGKSDSLKNFEGMQNVRDAGILNLISGRDVAIVLATGPAGKIASIGGKALGFGAFATKTAGVGTAMVEQSFLKSIGLGTAKFIGSTGAGIGAGYITGELTGNQDLAIIAGGAASGFFSKVTSPGISRVLGAEAGEVSSAVATRMTEAEIKLKQAVLREEVASWQAATAARQAEIGAIASNAGQNQYIYTISSIVKQDSVLLKEANMLGAGESRNINNMMNVLRRGGNPGIGSHSLEGLNNIMEARARNGARIYYRTNGNNIEILAYSNKNNQDKVISRLKYLYSN